VLYQLSYPGGFGLLRSRTLRMILDGALARGGGAGG